MPASLISTDVPKRYRALAAEAAQLAARVESIAPEADEQSIVDDRVFTALRDSGLCSVAVPSRWGGRTPTVDPVAVCVVREIFMPCSAHLDSLFALQGIGSYGLARAGGDAERERWLPKVATGEVLAALALTEPDVGSDLRAITTRIEDAGDRLLVNGQKSFISNGGAAGFYSVLGREADGYSMVVVPADATGVSARRTPDLIAPHVLGEITFDAVAVAPTARIGAPGRGFDHVLATLAVFRVSVAAAAVGLARAALEEAVRHAAVRRQFGRPLARHGQVAAMLADSCTELEGARLLTYRAATMARRNPAASVPYSSMAKLAATESASRVTDRAVQIMGRFGLVRGSKIERLYRQSRPMRIYEGASEILQLSIARSLVECVVDRVVESMDS